MVSRQLKRYRSNQQIEAFDCFGKFDTTIGDFVDDCISLGLKFSFENNIVFDDTSALLLGWERLFLYQYSLPFHAHYSVFILVANIHISNNIKIIIRYLFDRNAQKSCKYIKKLNNILFLAQKETNYNHLKIIGNRLTI